MAERSNLVQIVSSDTSPTVAAEVYRAFLAAQYPEQDVKVTLETVQGSSLCKLVGTLHQKDRKI